MELPNTIESCHVHIKQLLDLVLRLENRDTEREQVLAEQQKQIVALTTEVAELKARLNQNSRNSSKPPSSDFNKSNPGIPKLPKGRGGQVGHRGKNLTKVENPDHIVRLTTSVCSCGHELNPDEGSIVKTCQVFDLPEPKLETTEYQVIEQKCSCGRIHRGELPLGINASVQYGPSMRALTSLLSISCQLSYAKISQLIEDLYGYNLNESTCISNNVLVYEYLEKTEEQIKDALIESPVVHFDETGIRVENNGNWLHTACNAAFTVLFVSLYRGVKAHEQINSVLFQYSGWAVHDCYATYFKFKNCCHGLCGAHLLRELTAQIDDDKEWAQEIHAMLLDLYQKSDKGTKTVPNIAEVKKRFLELCQKALEIELLMLPPPGLDKKRGRVATNKPINLLKRLITYIDSVLAFAEYEVVPFTNNQAERDVRPAKTKQKVAGCFRTIDGAAQYARIQGFISTCRKQNFNAFNELKQVCSLGNSYTAPCWC